MQFVSLHFDKSAYRWHPVEGVEHYLRRVYSFYRLYPGIYLGIGGVVNLFAIVLTSKKHCLHNYFTIEKSKVFYYFFNTVFAARLVNNLYGFIESGVEFLDVVIHFKQGITHFRFPYHCGVAEYGYFSFREVFVSQLYGVVDDLRKLRMSGRFAISGKSNYINTLIISN